MRTESTIAAELRAAGCVFAEDEARLLVTSATSAADLAAMVRDRVAGAPLEQILGWAEFCGLRVTVEPGVFVPRRRTEYLVHIAASLIHRGDVVVDLCCGSGAVGRALLAAVPACQLHAADVDPAAVRCARRNLVPMGGQVHEGDLFDALPEELRGRVDVLVANAPYVPTDGIGLMPPEARLHEPLVALDGGQDGLTLHARIAANVADWLRPGGHVLIETSVAQADRTGALLAAAGLSTRVQHSTELDGTVVIGRATNESTPP